MARYTTPKISKKTTKKRNPSNPTSKKKGGVPSEKTTLTPTQAGKKLRESKAVRTKISRMIFLSFQNFYNFFRGHNYSSSNTFRSNALFSSFTP